MATVTAAMVKELREHTGLGMLECKNALVEADGDMAKAEDILRKKSAAKAAKKADRTASEGLLGVKLASDATRGVMVEVNIETDFAQKDATFGAFVETVVTAAYDDVETVSADPLAGAGAGVKFAASPNPFLGGATLLNPELPVANIKRIELVRGGASGLYGSGAVAGVVNVITYGPEDFSGIEASVSFANGATFRYSSF